jgi:hypothetical protein
MVTRTPHHPVSRRLLYQMKHQYGRERGCLIQLTLSNSTAAFEGGMEREALQPCGLRSTMRSLKPSLFHFQSPPVKQYPTHPQKTKNLSANYIWDISMLLATANRSSYKWIPFMYEFHSCSSWQPQPNLGSLAHSWLPTI